MNKCDGEAATVAEFSLPIDLYPPYVEYVVCDVLIHKDASQIKQLNVHLFL